MDKPLKCVVLLSLQEMALRRVAVLLCNDSDILDSILKFLKFRFMIDKKWQDFIEPQVKDKISKLELPESLAERVIDNIQCVGLEIRKWKKFHEYKFMGEHEKIGRPDATKLCWTTAGAIDYGKTAEKYVCYDRNFFLCPYKLACFYCLEKYIPALWGEFTALDKRNYLYVNDNIHDLGFCWYHIIEGKISDLDDVWEISFRNLASFNEWAFENSVVECNKSALEHFFQKLSLEEREASLVRSALLLLANPVKANFRKKRVFDVVCHLLCLMTAEQQMEVLKSRPADVLLCFLDSQWQDLFEENAGLIWTFLTPNDYADLLNKLKDGFVGSDHHFPKLFEKFLNRSPHSFKKYFVTEEADFECSPAFRLLWKFFDFEDSEFAEVLFRSINPEDRVKLIFEDAVLELFYDSLARDTCHIVEVCLREAKLSKEDRKRWKEGLMEYLKSFPLEPYEWEDSNLETFLESFDEADDTKKKGQKRKLESCSPES